MALRGLRPRTNSSISGDARVKEAQQQASVVEAPTGGGVKTAEPRVQLPISLAPWKANLFQYLDEAQEAVLAEGLSRTPQPGSRGFKFKPAKDRPQENTSCDEARGCTRLPDPTQRLVNDLRQFNYALQARPCPKPLAPEVVKQEAPVQNLPARAPTK